MTTYTSDSHHKTGDLRQKTAQECENMQEVRAEIDRLDRLLVRVIKERQDYMDAAARIKPARDHVRDEARIEDVVQKVLIEAKKQNLSLAIAEPVWRTMIERCIAYELGRWDESRKA